LTFNKLPTVSSNRFSYFAALNLQNHEIRGYSLLGVSVFFRPWDGPGISRYALYLGSPHG